LTNLHSGYLTGRQLDVWDKMRKGLTQSEVARKLSISRQAVHQLVETIPDKITEALNDAAKLNRIEPRYLDSTKAILFGRSRDFQTEAVIALDPKGGLGIWYQHSLGECNICPDRRRCKTALLRSAEALGVALTKHDKNLPPSKLSNLIFSKVRLNKIEERISETKASR
jgi:transcriptional regulator with XRE-family HTH domain